MYNNFNEVSMEIHFADWDQVYNIRYLYKDNAIVDIAIANVLLDFRLLHGMNVSTNTLALALMEVKDNPWSHKKKVSVVVTTKPIAGTL